MAWKKPQRPGRPALEIQPTTLWEYPSQNYGEGLQGDPAFPGATPSYVVWNLLKRYTREGDLVVDPCAGSGTTLDVARDLGRRALGYDVAPTRRDIFRADARKLPLEDGKAGFVFVDPPYSTHIKYSDDPRCIGRLDAATPAYFEAMEQVFGEIVRVLRPGGHMALYVCDSYVHGKGFIPIGIELFQMLRKRLEPVDVVSVVRHNRTLEQANHRKAAVDGNYFLRGFNYLFVMRKSGKMGEEPRARTDGPRARTEAPRARTEAPRARTEAPRARTEAQRARTEAQRAKADGPRAATDGRRAKN